MKRILALRKSLLLVIHSGTGTPLAMNVHIPKLVGWLTTGMVAVLILGAGSLLFFRELEINRKLQSRLLVFETEERLWQTSWNGARDLANQAAPTTPPARTESVASAEAVKAAQPTPNLATGSTAKISELAHTCNGEECQVRLGLSTNGAGVAEGFLLIVLETEVPRIGANTAPQAQMRKRYFLYPEQEPRDELDSTALAKLEQKAFRFGKGLKTTANFKVGKLLRPLSINAYLFDSKHALVQHERRAITEEP